MREMSTGDIITTKKLQSQKKPVEMATDVPRVCSGVNSTGSKKASPLVPMAQTVLKMLTFRHQQYNKIYLYRQNDSQDTNYGHVSACFIAWIRNCGGENSHADTLPDRPEKQ